MSEQAHEEAKIKAEDVKKLDSSRYAVYKRAVDAAGSGNHKYAIDLFGGLLRRNPGVSEVRERLRASQLAAIGGGAVWWRTLLAFVIVPKHRFNASQALKAGKYGEALYHAELAMTFNPTSVPACLLLADMAEAASCGPLLLQTLEWAVRYNPNSIPLLERLALANKGYGDPRRAVQCYQKLAQMQPHVMKWNESAKQTGALVALDSGWNEIARGESDFRSAIRDKDTAARLEQADRISKTESGLAQLLTEQLAKIAADPSIGNYQKLGQLYHEAKDYDQALAAYEKSIEIAGAIDPSLDEEMTKIKSKQYDESIAEWRQHAAQPGLADADKQAAAEHLAALEAEKDQVRFEWLQRHVRSVPTAYRERLQLARLYMERGEPDVALDLCQSLYRNPNLGYEAALLAGMCFMKKQLYDLAQEQFQRAVDNIEGMTPVRKEALYQLGHCLLTRGDQEGARNAFKTVYSADMRFRDVKDLVEGKLS